MRANEKVAIVCRPCALLRLARQRVRVCGDMLYRSELFLCAKLHGMRGEMFACQDKTSAPLPSPLKALEVAHGGGLTLSSAEFLLKGPTDAFHWRRDPKNGPLDRFPHLP